MDRAEAYKRFSSQRHGARQRGIEWCLTFDEWLDWWGEDLGSRGRKPWNMQMQRFHDKGPYALGNIRKGTPQDNMRTAGCGKRNARQERLAQEHQAALGALPIVGRDEADEDEQELCDMFLPRVSCSRWGSV